MSSRNPMMEPRAKVTQFAAHPLNAFLYVWLRPDPWYAPSMRVAQYQNNPYIKLISVDEFVAHTDGHSGSKTAPYKPITALM